MTRTVLHVAAAILTACGSAAALADDPKPLPIGAGAPDFHLPGVDGKTYSLSNFAGAKVLFVIFTCNHCPTAQAYEDRLLKLHADYKDRGVALVAINPNDSQAVRLDELGYTDLSDSLEEMKLRAQAKRRVSHGSPPHLMLWTTEKDYTAVACGMRIITVSSGIRRCNRPPAG